MGPGPGQRVHILEIKLLLNGEPSPLRHKAGGEARAAPKRHGSGVVWKRTVKVTSLSVSNPSML